MKNIKSLAELKSSLIANADGTENGTFEELFSDENGVISSDFMGSKIVIAEYRFTSDDKDSIQVDYCID